MRLLAGLVLFLTVDALAFDTPLYRSVVAPDSSTGTFDRALRRVDGSSRSRARDVLVLGDSRTYGDLDERVADEAAGDHVRFLNAGVPGATPRCWTVFDRALDPEATRYRAVVVPVDSYDDDDGSIGSVDGNDRAMDLHYVVDVATPSDIWSIATSFPTLDGKLRAFAGLVLRGPLLRADVQAFVADPWQRLNALRDGRADGAPRPRVGSLRGLKVDFAHDTLVAPRAASHDDDAMLVRQVLHRARYDASYARYRRQWLGFIVRRYRTHGIPVVLVRLPTRPLHRSLPPPPRGTVVAFAADDGALVLPQAPYVALERPDYFADADHLNVAGARAFSRRLGRDVRVALDATRAAPVPAYRPPPAAVVARRSDAVAWLSFGVPIAFQSYEFVLFLGVVAAAYRVLPHGRSRDATLLAASWYFYARWNAWYLVVLLGLTTIDYFVALFVRRDDGSIRRRLLALGIAIDLAFLGTAKYADLLTGTISRVLGLHGDPWALHVLVPVGISFHTFQSISYLVDVSRGRVRPMRSYLDYALYLAFFPQLLAGPIVRAAPFFADLIARRTVDADDVAYGCRRILVGSIKKSVLADRFAASSDAYFGAIATHPGALAAWTGALAFALQIYFDFSGYSDIAIGSAALFGLRFPENFDRPYLAPTVSAFWRRWHVTLSSWLRDYVYVPLGGSRGTTATTVRNLMATMLLGGLWHGAAWTFVIWGGYHGALLAVERVTGYARFVDAHRANLPIRTASTAATFVAVLVGWVVFRTPDLGDAAVVLRAMVGGGGGGSSLALPAIVLACVALALELRRERVGRATPILIAVSLGVLELASYPDASAPFVYFRF